MSFLVVSAAIGGAGLLYNGYKSIKQNAEANKIDKNNPRPDYQIPDEYKQNVAMAKHMAQIGLPQQQYNNQLNAINQNQAATIGALSRSANPGANLAAIVRGGDNATANLNAQDAAARQNNDRYYIGQNAALGQQKLAQQQYNKFDKYTEDYNKSAALRGASAQNLQNGINGAAGLASSLYGMNQLSAPASQTAQNSLGPRVAPQSLSDAQIQASALPEFEFNKTPMAQPMAMNQIGPYTRYASPVPYFNQFHYTDNF